MNFSELTFMHEIRNSLGNIYNLVELLSDEISDNKNAQEYITIIKDSIEHVRRIDEDYRVYKTACKNITKESFFIDNLIESILLEYKVSIEEKKISIQLNVPHIHIYTDKTKFKQAISNIISNAIKYNRINGSITINVYGSLTIEVKDTGIGIKKKDLEKIGSKFYRIKEIEIEGSGLGISLIKRICNKMQWELSIESLYGQYTIFRIII